MHQRLLAALLGAALCGPVAASAQTAVYRRSPADTLSGSVSTERTGRYEVVGDSVIDGLAVLVVRSDAETRLTTTDRPSADVEVLSTLQGRRTDSSISTQREAGWSVVHRPESCRAIWRSRAPSR